MKQSVFYSVSETTWLSCEPASAYGRVVTNLECLEFLFERGKLREFCATSAKKIVKVVLVRRSDICVKQLLIGYTGSYMVRVWW